MKLIMAMCIPTPQCRLWLGYIGLSYSPVRYLRSSICSFLIQKSTKILDERAFADTGPALWTNLPIVIIQNAFIQTHLKEI